MNRSTSPSDDPWADVTAEDLERMRQEVAAARARAAAIPRRTPPRDHRTGRILSH